jgi:hypothetical protein
VASACDGGLHGLRGLPAPLGSSAPFGGWMQGPMPQWQDSPQQQGFFQQAMMQQQQQQPAQHFGPLQQPTYQLFGSSPGSLFQPALPMAAGGAQGAFSS